MTFHNPLQLFKSLSVLMLAAVVSLGVSNPRPAAAGPSDVVGGAIALGIIGTAAYCATHPDKCGAQASTRNGGTPRAGDAIGLNRSQAMMIQGGLQNLGFYNGAIDGAIGAGTRASIRQYQAAIGANVTGLLTAQQINDLVALSPGFVSYGDDPVYMMRADLANDLSRDEVRQLQAQLNAMGYAAGPVDGAFGGMTRRAIASYKANEGLPGGPLATRRLLAYMMGWPAPTPAGAQFASMPLAGGGTTSSMSSSSGMSAGGDMGGATETGMAMDAEEEPAGDLTFDLVGVTLGMSEDEIMSGLQTQLGADITRDSANMPGDFGGSERLDTASLYTQPNWPGAASEQVIALFDSARPELGALAEIRLIHMPENVDEVVFEEQILPEIIAKYGEEAQFGNGRMWVGDADAREAARADATKLASCGSLKVDMVGDGTWSSGNGPRLDTASLDTVTKDCGQVLRVSYVDNVIRIALWDSSVLSNARTAPKIKF